MEHSSICSCEQCQVTRKEINDSVAPGVALPANSLAYTPQAVSIPVENECRRRMCVRPAHQILHGCGTCIMKSIEPGVN